MSPKPAPAGGRGGSGTGRDPSPRPRDLDPCIGDEAVKYLSMSEVQVGPSLGRHFWRHAVAELTAPRVSMVVLLAHVCLQELRKFVWRPVTKADHKVFLTGMFRLEVANS